MMDSGLKEFIENLVCFKQYTRTTYDRDIRDENNETTLHPSNFIVHSGHTEYIPTCFLHKDMITVDMKTLEIASEFVMSLTYFYNHDFTGDLINEIKTPSILRSTLQMISKSTTSSYYFNNGMIMDDEEIIFCSAIKTDYIKKLFIDTYKQFHDNKFFDLLMEHDLENTDEANTIVNNRYLNMLNNLDFEEVMDNVTIFIDEDRLSSFCNRNYITYSNAFGRNSKWSELRCIRDSLGEWFNSKLFVQPELPKFKDLDGPEKHLMELLHEDISSGNEPSSQGGIDTPDQTFNLYANSATHTQTTADATTLNIGN